VTDGVDIVALERRLAPLSHGTEAIAILRETMQALNKRERQLFLNGNLVRAPIDYDRVRSQIGPPPEPFFVLQGDVIRTDAAYILGSRLSGGRSYIVATSTCDAVPGRRDAALLLPVEARRLGEPTDHQRVQNDLANLITFKTTRYLYLPPLPDDDPNVLFNVAFLDPFAQCENAALALAERRASMTLLGWRVVGALLRSIQVREAAEEVAIRLL
jgi:hypothetical protein